jgi:hypothetical protein
MDEEIRTKNHETAAVSKQTSPQTKSEKSGFLKRFLDWIAKGANQANMGAQSCPS